MRLNNISNVIEFPSPEAAIETIVKNTEAAIIANTALNWGTLPKKVYFIYDTPKQVVKTLQELTNSTGPYKNMKYPLVILFEDIKQSLRQGMNGLTSSFKARIVICTLTDPNYRAPQRDIENFNPILIPIAQELLRQFSLSKVFSMPGVNDMGTESLEMYKRYSWGSVEVDKNILNDYIDAIEFPGISLNLKTIC